MPWQIKQDVNGLEHRGRDGCEEANFRVSLIKEQQAPINDRKHALREAPVDITVDEAISEHTSWDHTFASFSSFPINKFPTLQGQRFIRDSMSLEPAFGGECQRTFHLADIPSEEEPVLKRDSNNARHKLSSILIVTQGQEI